MSGPASLQCAQYMAWYGHQRHEPTHSSKTQRQHYLSRNLAPHTAQYQEGDRSQSPQVQIQRPYARVDRYAHSINQPGHSIVDTRFPLQHFPYNVHGGYADKTPCARSNSESVAVPSFPRGPPRKPKQSGYALWVGNLPPAATIADLKDHFSRGANSEIQSVFLITKSNCAFVNYRSESSCLAAVERFNGSGLHGIRLVCRLKRTSASTANASVIAKSPKPAVGSNSAPRGLVRAVAIDELSDPVIVDSTPTAPGTTGTIMELPNPVAAKAPKLFFVLKSLTLQDLVASVRDGIWATQAHNESRLNRAFNTADNVYLIFSANKSGEYFGYARMASSIVNKVVPGGSAPNLQPPNLSDGLRSMPTPATETAPCGRITDDSVRGTIFWEAESSGDGTASWGNDLRQDDGEHELGRPFQVEWVSTARLPFYRTRGLRNTWNANKEVKIARDGTELEPSVGERLVQMFHRPM